MACNILFFNPLGPEVMVLLVPLLIIGLGVFVVLKLIKVLKKLFSK